MIDLKTAPVQPYSRTSRTIRMRVPFENGPCTAVQVAPERFRKRSGEIPEKPVTCTTCPQIPETLRNGSGGDRE